MERGLKQQKQRKTKLAKKKTKLRNVGGKLKEGLKKAEEIMTEI